MRPPAATPGGRPVTRCAGRVALLLAVAGLTSGCLSDEVEETAEHVLTLRGGTMSELRTRVGSGPYTAYDIPPQEMLEVLEDAARKARGEGGRPVTAIFVSARRRQVVAKERPPDEASDDGYSAPFLSAMIATVWPVRGDPEASRVEIHAMRSGPFHKGVVQWVRDMPRWIDEVLAARRAAQAAPLKPIP